MCPTAVFYQGLILLALVVVFVTHRQVYRVARVNLATVSSLLQFPELKYGIFNLQMTLGGYYKNRKVVMSYSPGEADNEQLRFPHLELDIPGYRQKIFMLRYPQPTAHTQVRGRRIYYFRNSRARWSFGNASIIGGDEFIAVLDELSRAAEIVEKNPGGFV